MKIRPLRTLPLRLQLRIESRVNARRKARIEERARRIAPSSNEQLDAPPGSILLAKVHPYAGLGHQVSSWVSGYLWAQDLGVAYGGGSLTRDRVGVFRFRTASSELAPGVHVRLSAVNNERDARSTMILRHEISRAVQRYRGVPLTLHLSLDQARWDQTRASEALRRAMLEGSMGDKFRVLEAESPGYIALHVRRGDVGAGATGGAGSITRWVEESWYVTVLRVLRAHPSLRELRVRVYALGSESDFPELAAEGVDFHLNGDVFSDLVELAAARLLVAAPSSFSFTAGMCSKGVVLARAPWWHFVPNEGRWVAVANSGVFAVEDLDRAIQVGWEGC